MQGLKFGRCQSFVMNTLMTTDHYVVTGNRAQKLDKLINITVCECYKIKCSQQELLIC